MAGTPISSWDTSFRKAEQPETPAAVEVGHLVNRLRRGLSRTSAQSRRHYEAVLEAFGSTTTPEWPEVEDVQVEEAFQNLHVSDISDTATCSSHEDDRADNHSIYAFDYNSESSAAWDRHDNSGQDLRTKDRKLSDEEWAKSILGRKTGYGSIQRHRVVKYRTDLETKLTELQTEVFTLYSRVSIFDKHRRYLQAENDALHQKIGKLSQYQLLNEEQHVFLQQELQLLRMQQAEQQLLLQLESRGSATSVGVPSTGRGNDASVIQLRDHDIAQSDLQTTGAEPEFGEAPHGNETSRDQSMAESWSKATSGIRQKDGEEARQQRTVKWPSTLYRSVSAIRKDSQMQQPEHLLQQLDSGPRTSEGCPSTGHGIDTSVIQLRDHDIAQSDLQTTGAELEFKESPYKNETSRIQSMADSWSRARSGFWQDDDEAIRLVKWPSTLYRSVSSIKKDVLSELAVLKSNND